MPTQIEITQKIAKLFDEFKQNEKNKQKLEKELIAQTKKELGKDIFKHYHLPADFDTKKLEDKEIFSGRFEEKHSFPFTDEQFDHFIGLEKFPITSPVVLNEKNNKIQGVYLAAKDNGRLILYALTIVNEGGYNEFDKTTIRLEMSVGGKEWMSLLRLDNSGAPHPNYIENRSGGGRNLVDDYSQIKGINPPHIHKNCHDSEVIAHAYKDYTPATEISEPVYDLKHALDYFMSHANIKAKINPEIAAAPNYRFTYGQDLFDSADIDKGKDKFENIFLEICEQEESNL